MAGATGSGPVLGPCSAYADWADVEACGCGGVTIDDVDEQDLWLSLATEVVFGITGGKFLGQCVRSMTPCRPGCVRSGCCTCTAKASIDLGPQPVWGAFVTLDGEEIEVSVRDWRYVIREDGLPWPDCTEGELLVEVTYGWPIPTGLRMATARLSCEFAKQCKGLPCGLDPRTTSYTREGISVEIADPQAMIAGGRTGIPFVDSILGNPMFRVGGHLVDLAAEAGYRTTWP